MAGRFFGRNAYRRRTAEYCFQQKNTRAGVYNLNVINNVNKITIVCTRRTRHYSVMLGVVGQWTQVFTRRQDTSSKY